MNVIANTLLLFAVCTLLSPAQDGVYPEPHHKYVLVAPGSGDALMCPSSDCAPTIQIRAIRIADHSRRRVASVTMPLHTPSRVKPHATSGTTNRAERVSLLIR